jgi:hypothetical protein
MAEALLEGGAAAVTHALMARALKGNATAMKLWMERLVPPRRERAVRVAMPAIAGPGDVAPAMAAIAAAAASGEISPADAGELARMVETLMRAFQVSDFERRLGEIEATLAARP